MESALCLDAGVVVSFLCGPQGDDAVDQFFAQILRRRFVCYAPAVLGHEFAAVLSKMQKQQVMTQSQAQKALKLFLELPLIFVDERDLLAQNLEWARSGIPSVSRRAYLSVAKSKEVPLITRDAFLLQKAKKFYPAIFSVGEWVS